MYPPSAYIDDVASGPTVTLSGNFLIDGAAFSSLVCAWNADGLSDASITTSATYSAVTKNVTCALPTSLTLGTHSVSSDLKLEQRHGLKSFSFRWVFGKMPQCDSLRTLATLSTVGFGHYWRHLSVLISFLDCSGAACDTCVNEVLRPKCRWCSSQANGIGCKLFSSACSSSVSKVESCPST